MSDAPSSSLKRVVVEAFTRQFPRFALVGVVTTFVHYAVLITLVELWAISPVLGTTAGFMTAALVSYVLNRRYTFDVSPEFGRGLLIYYSVLFVGLVLNALIVAGLSKQGLPYLYAQLVATSLVLIWNFLAARFVVFRG